MTTPVQLRICIDVDDLERGIAFYTAAIGLSVARRLGDGWAELAGAPVPIDLLAKASGSFPYDGAVAARAPRAYVRHWTPVHLDIVVSDIDSAVARAVAEGAVLEHPISTAVWGRMANLSDPWGHGLCILQYLGRGYDELLSPAI